VPAGPIHRHQDRPSLSPASDARTSAARVYFCALSEPIVTRKIPPTRGRVACPRRSLQRLAVGRKADLTVQGHLQFPTHKSDGGRDGVRRFVPANS